MKKKFNFQKPGKCPMCGSDNLDYQDSEQIDNHHGYEFTCEDCNFEGVEWYEEVYRFSEGVKK